MAARLLSCICRIKIPSSKSSGTLLVSFNSSSIFSSTLIGIFPGIRCIIRAHSSDTPLCHYTVLGVAQNASQADIRSAYINKSKQLHPDTCPENNALHSEFVRVAEAYGILKNVNDRAEYDNTIGFTSYYTTPKSSNNTNNNNIRYDATRGFYAFHDYKDAYYCSHNYDNHYKKYYDAFDEFYDGFYESDDDFDGYGHFYNDQWSKQKCKKKYTTDKTDKNTDTNHAQGKHKERHIKYLNFGNLIRMNFAKKYNRKRVRKSIALLSRNQLVQLLRRLVKKYDLDDPNDGLGDTYDRHFLNYHSKSSLLKCLYKIM